MKDKKAGTSTADKPQVAGEDAWQKCALQLSRSYEADFGGFSMSPKFPQPSNFNFLFHLHVKEKDTERGFQCLEMCLHTLKKMAYGGIHDHVNKGRCFFFLIFITFIIIVRTFTNSCYKIYH